MARAAELDRPGHGPAGRRAAVGVAAQVNQRPTARKMILNAFSTTLMIKLGRIWSNLMVVGRGATDNQLCGRVPRNVVLNVLSTMLVIKLGWIWSDLVVDMVAIDNKPGAAGCRGEWS